ncbi:late competence development ComFB family protein [Pannus brasiliensis CCIBt3594]|uniref:Late competence development ComFB family protein n=1 Tax=Pannus brasiliensis CCIBt3594 TaxID=1427578 RepID=A0AAW9QU71_9CHRO
MSIKEIVEQALREGYLTPSMEAEVGRVCDTAGELSIEEYRSLDRLMGALLTGEVVGMPRKQFINVMEELVIAEAIARAAEIESFAKDSLDIGDIAAYALNRLPPLYATTEEGASYQRQRAREDLQEMIRSAVKEALDRFLFCPVINPDRVPIAKPSREDTLTSLHGLLKSHAVNYEPRPAGPLD